MFRVTEAFTDAKDNRHVYRAGDEYPRPGYKPTKARVKELSTEKNRRGKPLIEEIDK